MHVTIQVRVDNLSAQQTIACLKDAFTDEVSIEQAIEDSIAHNAGQRSASAVVYACRPTDESLALFSMPGGGMVGCILVFVYPSNETLLALAEHTIGVIGRQVKRSKGKFQFVRARLEDDSSLGTAVESQPSGWLDRVRAHMAQRDLTNNLVTVAVLAVLASVFSEFRDGMILAGVGVVVSLVMSLAQSALERRRIEWRVR